MLRNTSEVDGNKRLAVAGRIAVKQAGYYIFSRTILTQYQDVGIGIAQFVYRRKYFLHSSRFSDNGLFGTSTDTVTQYFHLLFQQIDFTSRTPEFHTGRKRSQQFFLLPWFGNKVRSTRLDGTYRLVGIGIGGHKNNHSLRVDGQYLFQTVETFLSANGITAEVHIQQDDIRLKSRHKMFYAVGGHGYFYFLYIRFEEEVQREEDIFVIIHYQYLT